MWIVLISKNLLYLKKILNTFLEYLKIYKNSYILKLILAITQICVFLVLQKKNWLAELK